jgi:predicted glycosyltransferase
MRFLFDIVHPAHVHFFKHMIRALQANGHETTIVARDKDVTRSLLDTYKLSYSSIGRGGQRSRLGQLRELVTRDHALVKIARSFKPDTIVTRNPSGVQVARMLGLRGVFDTDDGRAAGVHFKAAAPFASTITTPDCLDEDFGRKHVKYPGYKQSAYLHPDHYQPDPSIFELLGLNREDRYFIVRFVSMSASHDRGESGLDVSAKHRLIDKLKHHGRVFVTSESKLPLQWEPYRISIPPHRIHDALAFATLCVGDSQTMAAEAAYLGTPSIRLSTFAGRISYLEEMQHRYGLTYGFKPDNVDLFFEKIDEMLALEDIKKSVKGGWRRMQADKSNIAKWFVDFLQAS